MAATLRDLDTSIDPRLRERQRSAEALDDVALAAAVLEQRKRRDAIAAEESVLLAELERRRSYSTPATAGTGFASPSSNPYRHRTSGLWLAAETHQSQTRCGGAVRQATDLDRLPIVHAALLDGAISEAHVGLILAAFRTKHMPDHIAEAQDRLCDWARRLPWPTFAKRIKDLIEILDDEDPATKALRLAQKRGIDVLEIDELVQIVITTTHEAKDQFLAAIEPRAQALAEEDWAEAREIHGDKACWSDLDRTDRQRLHDGWLANTRAGATADDPGARFDVDLVLDLDTAEREVARNAGETPPARTLEEALDATEHYSCESLSGTRWNPALAAAAVAVGRLRRVVLGAPDRNITSSVHTRTYRGNNRRDAQIRDRHCAMPGCETASHLCEIDHIVPVEQGGLTTPSNGQPLCRPCHRWKTLLDALGFP